MTSRRYVEFLMFAANEIDDKKNRPKWAALLDKPYLMFAANEIDDKKTARKGRLCSTNHI